jgi:LuxR family maltose regulon positive regulatory protein
MSHRLDEGMLSKLTIVSAPAGFGKTTLLAEWAGRRKQFTAWLSLDESDNTPERFWAYFIGAFQGLRAGLGSDPMELLHERQSSMETVLTFLINELAGLSEEAVFVLDDYQYINDPAIHTALAFFIERMPASLHLFLISRADPPLPLTRLRARGELIEIRAADLRFTFQEAAAFLNEVIGEKFSNEEIAEYASRTEGWIAGLQLMGLSIQRRRETEAPGVLEGTNRYIVDYLTAEVLDHQSEEMRSFLLRTSILDRMCGSLCDAVTGGNDGQQMLTRAEEENLYIVALDDNRDWYRYQHLFGRVLRDRLQQEGTEPVAELHRRASQWYERNGFIQESVEHLLRGGDIERGIRLAERYAETMLHSGTVEPLLRWMKLFPEDQIASRPRLALAFAWALLLNGQLDDVGKYLEFCRHAIQPGPEGGLADVSGHLATVSQVLASFRHEREEEGRPQERGTRQAQYPTTTGYHQKATSGGGQSGERDIASRFGVLDALPQVAGLQIRMGQLQSARQTCTQALELTTDEQLSLATVIPAAAAAHIGLAEIFYEYNDLQEAMQQITEALKLSRERDDTTVMRDGYILLAKIHQARGDLDGALDALDQLEHFLRKHPSAHDNFSSITAHRVRVWLAQGNLQASAQWAQQWKADWMNNPSDIEDVQLLTLARVFIAQYKADEALELLSPALSTAEGKKWNDTMIRALVLQALALDQQGDAEQALSGLSRALAMAAPEGYTRTFVNEGAPMIRLLLRVREGKQSGELDAAQPVPTEYLDKLLTVLGVVMEVEPKIETQHHGMDDPTVRFPSTSIRSALITPLSDREVEVLKLIEEGKTNAAIADSLYISVSTVKTHINNLYSKLGVETRTQALARAREYRLL